MEFNYFVYNEKGEIEKESKDVGVTKGSHWSCEERKKRGRTKGRRMGVVGINSGKYGRKMKKKGKKEKRVAEAKEKERKSALETKELRFNKKKPI